MFNRLSGHYVNLVTSGLYLALLFVAWRMHRQFTVLHDWPLWWWLGLLTGLFCFAFNCWRMQKIAQVPISTIAGAAQGYIELNGTASSVKPMQTPYMVFPVSGIVAGHMPHKANKCGVCLIFVQSDEPILLNDGTGQCSVLPQDAEVIYFQKHTINHHNHRYVEEYLPTKQSLYVLGELDTRHLNPDEKVIHRQVGELLLEWRKTPAKLLFRFDHNLNGKIDEDEWQLARAEARKEVEARHQNQAHLGEFVLAKPRSGQLFLISGISPVMLRAYYQFWAVLHLLVLLVLAYLSLYLF